MAKKITTEEVDARLKNKNIKRLDNYINNSTKINFECLNKNCYFIWQTKPNYIFSGNGCPKCAGVAKITESDLDLILKIKNIKRIDNYINGHTKIKFQCLKENCKYIWKTTVASIKYRENGSCPKCSKKAKLTNQDIDIRILNKKIKRIDNYINGYTKINFKCLICKYIWLVKPESIINKNTGCPNCAQKVKLNNNTFDEKILNRPIKRLDNYVNAYTKINFKCLNDNCSNEWMACPAAILHTYTGCPNCNKISKNEKLLYNLLLTLNIDIKPQFSLRNFNKKEKLFIVDFYLPNFNLIIEYNGGQHYAPVCFGGISIEKAKNNFIKQVNRDEYVRNYCKNNNINLIEIDGRIINGKKINKDYLLKILSQYINNF
jgi:hypothetical protein